MKYEIILFYKYVTIDDPELERRRQIEKCRELDLVGRTIVSCEGINATLEGLQINIAKYIEWMKKDTRFSDIHFKISEGTGDSFPKLSVKVRDEIVSLHLGGDDINPNETTGKYLPPEKLHAWIHDSKREFYIVDMRNDYELASGYFENTVFPGMKHFRDLPKCLPKIAHLKDKTIVTVCTGGVRCEKASGYLLTQGFSDVYQLQGGIVSYMEKYPNEDFHGKLYVFDKRIVMGFHTDEASHVIVGECVSCKKKSDHYVNCRVHGCNRHFILCEDCSGGVQDVTCPHGCKNTSVAAAAS